MGERGCRFHHCNHRKTYSDDVAVFFIELYILNYNQKIFLSRNCKRSTKNCKLIVDFKHFIFQFYPTVFWLPPVTRSIWTLSLVFSLAFAKTDALIRASVCDSPKDNVCMYSVIYTPQYNVTDETKHYEKKYFILSSNKMAVTRATSLYSTYSLASVIIRFMQGVKIDNVNDSIGMLSTVWIV